MQSPDFLSRCVLGTAILGGVWGQVDTHKSVNTILASFENGITGADTAPAHGDAEEFVGIALHQWKVSIHV